jgi:hypothetical protein
METLQDRKVVTRKSHNCWGCRREYPAGTTMQLITESEGNHIMNSYWCNICMDFRATLEPYQVEDGFDFGDMLNFDDYIPFSEVVNAQ